MKALKDPIGSLVAEPSLNLEMDTRKVWVLQPQDLTLNWVLDIRLFK